MRRDPTKPRPWAVRLVRLLSRLLIVRRYRIGSRGSPGVRPPYILLSNHVNYWDPFFIGALLPDTVQYVTSDNIFRSRLFGTIMTLLASIPKTKFMPDSTAVRRVLTVLRANRGVVGIFPEGRRTWDGRSIAPMPEVPRLIKAAAVPVVFAKQYGGYLVQPRWARYRSRGPVSVEFSLLFSREQVAELTPAEIYDRIAAAVDHDDAAWCAAVAGSYRNRAPAEYLERLLFVCPGCRSFSRLVSRGNSVTCGHCGLAHRYSASGRFVATVETESVKSPFFGTPVHWNGWQVAELARRMTAGRDGDAGNPAPLFADPGVRLLTGYRSARVRSRDCGTLALTSGGILLTGEKRWLFPFAEIEGVNVQNTEALEFYYQGTLFRFEQSSPRSNAYKWLKAAQIGAGALTPALRQSVP